MKMDALLRYGLPGEVIALWKEREGAALLPLQERAVKREGLFDGGNVLIQAPTSSGKTFIGEMAAVETALRRKKVVYLAPLKALAEEKYRSFREKYSEYGIEVIVSSRDHREFDGRFEAGDFSIAVAVYEKLAQLLVRRPERLEEIELIVADELEILSDPERGAMAELLLTRVLMGPCRVIGMSAVIGGAEALAGWMNARLVHHEQRPVELRYGVLHEGRFRYRTYNEYSEACETLVDAQTDSMWETLTRNVCEFAARGETCLVFMKAKQETRRGAELLAGELDGAAAKEAIGALRKLEATRSRDVLLQTLESGVAFHNADLSPHERRIVEQAFRVGEIRVMIATSTLAVGLNMPARNVFIAPEKWRYDVRFGAPWKAPIARAEYENMGGRAGRYGAGHEFGRSILIASTAFDEETLWRRYIDGARETIEPQLAKGPLEDHVLQLVTSRACATEREVYALLERTLSGRWVWQRECSPEEIELRIRAAANRGIDAGMLTRVEEERLEATPLGQAVASKGIRIATARELEGWIGESETRRWRPLDLLLAAAMTSDGRMYSVALTAREYDQADYVGRLKAACEDEPVCANVPLGRMCASNAAPFFEEVRAIKIALMLEAWIEQSACHAIEETFDTMAGQVLAAADQLSWLIDAAAAIATAQGCAGGFVEHVRVLSHRVQRGLREETLRLAGLMEEAGLSRGAMLALAEHGLDSVEALADAPLELIERCTTRAQAKAVKAWAAARASAMPVVEAPLPSMAPRVVLVVDDRNPDRVMVDGVAVTIQEKQYRLIRMLAASPGECVPYEELYAAVWGECIVEDNQMHYQKSELLKRIGGVVPSRRGMIKTVPKRGFVLALTPEEVELREREVEVAVA
ncbi:MAG: DEAD/DEAH box helicase [Candidatus Hydrogenedentota bacterium]